MPPSLDQEAPVAGDGAAPLQVTLVTEQLEKPLLDTRDYRLVRLANDLEVLLVHDKDTDKASAALTAHVGYYSDEADMPGMAHAVEHLLFMGTKKFPAENEYDKYLAAHSGYCNASTSGMNTCYYFEVAAKSGNEDSESEKIPSPLYGALDRFSQFFIAPLFNPDGLERELQAVDSENNKNLQNDHWRMSQLDKSLANPNHPYCHFGTGNFHVLKTAPEAKGVNIQEKFKEFFSKYYSANRMSLVVLGHESLDVLQSWAAELFSPIINKNLQPNRWPDELPLRKSELGTQCFMKPIMDLKQLCLQFPFLDQEFMFASRPSSLIGHLIGHEGPGSIYSYLKGKGWTSGLSAGAYDTSPGSPGFFDIEVDLTEEGLKNYTEVVKVIFQYINLLRETPTFDTYFEEKKKMADIKFDFRPQTSPAEITRRISNHMKHPMPREWLLDTDRRPRSLDPGQIKEGLAALRPDNFRMMIVSRTYPGVWDKKEKWYSTEYSNDNIPSGLMKEIEEAAAVAPDVRIPELFLPGKNDFIPSQLKVERSEVERPALALRLLRNDPIARTWWKKDDTFWVPRANVLVYLKTPLVHVSAENMVKAKLFAELICDALKEYSYAASLAGLEYRFDLDRHGFFVEVKGYNDKLSLLLEKVISTIRDLDIQPDRFSNVKEKLQQDYNDWEIQSPFEQIDEYLAWLNASTGRYMGEELLKELPHATIETIGQFRQQILAQLHIEVCVHGNLYKEDALDLTSKVESILKPRTLPEDQWSITRSLLLPTGSNFVYNKVHQDPSNTNNCVCTWFYTGDSSDVVVRAKTLLMTQMLKEPAFAQLRTKEQLGYVVRALAQYFPTTIGAYFLVQGAKPPGYLDSRIEAFLSEFAEVLNESTEDEIEQHKKSLIGTWAAKLRDLDSETSRLCAQVRNGYYDFEFVQKDVNQIKALTKQDMVEFFNQHLNPASTQRARLSVHIHAQTNEQGIKDAKAQVNGVVSEGEKEQQTVAVKQAEQNGITAVNSATEITGVRAFKSKLAVSPGPQPVKDVTEFMD